MTEKLTEQDLLAECRSGSREAFESLYRANQRRVFSVALNFFGGNRETAEDVTQQVFLKIYNKIGDFRGDAFSFWRPTIAPVRATLRPLKAIQAIAKTEQQGARDWLAIVKVTWSPRWIAGRLTGADFRDPTSTLDESWEYVAGGAYVLVDFSEIIWP